MNVIKKKELQNIAFSLAFCFIFFLILMTSCNEIRNILPGGQTPTVRLSPIFTATPPLIPTFTVTPLLTPTFTASPMISNETIVLSTMPATETGNQSIKHVTQINPDPSLGISQEIPPYWSSDENEIIFLTQTFDQQPSYHWNVYDLISQSTHEIPPPIQNNPQIWRALGVRDPQEEGYDPLMQGYISPSGKHLIYPVYIKDLTLPDNFQTQIWISARDGSHRKKLIQTLMYSSISRAVWINDEKQVIFDLLGVEKAIGAALTENYAMMPPASVSGYIFSHPGSTYFNLGKIDSDQLKDYAKRKKFTNEEAAKWLSPNL